MLFKTIFLVFSLFIVAVQANIVQVTQVDYLGMTSFETGYTFNNTEVGGLSGITYDANSNIYYSLSDDRSNSRFYTLTIDVSDNSLDDGDIAFQSVVTLLDENGNVFADLDLDPEGITLTSDNTLYITSEGDETALIAPFINEFNLNGQQISSLPVDNKYLPTTETMGIRNNKAFESATLTPDQNYLITATEEALKQDGPAADLENQSLARIIKYNLATQTAIAEYVYIVDPVREVPEPEDSFSTNGLVELLALDSVGNMLALERSFSVGKGNMVHLYYIETAGALNVITEEDLYWEAEDTVFEIDPAVTKTLLLDFDTLGFSLDNLEGITFGPQLSDGRQVLIVVSDNNFSSVEGTQFIALALTLETFPSAKPTYETQGFVDNEEIAANNQLIAGDADDPAIWLHPSDSSQSLVITAVKDGGLAVFDLQAQLVQRVVPAEYGEIRYNNVDLIYNFNLNGNLADLAVASDRGNDTLAVFEINPDTGYLTDITASTMLETIFGIDDGGSTAYGLATYSNTSTDKHYAFVSQRDNNQVAQLELMAEADGTVSAEVVRMIAVPVATGDPEDSQVEGMAADNELGYIYIAIEDEAGAGIYKYSADPDADDTIIHTLDMAEEADYLESDLEGLTIYYAADGTGYLIVSSQGNNSFALYRREGNNDYIRLVSQ